MPADFGVGGRNSRPTSSGKKGVGNDRREALEQAQHGLLELIERLSRRGEEIVITLGTSSRLRV